MTETPVGDSPPAIHRWPDQQWADNYASQVSAQAWHVVDLDTRLRWDKKGFLAACRRSFGFPQWFGMNWDALADSLSDVAVPPGAGVLVPWRGWGPMARMYPADFAVATDILVEWVTRSGDRSETVLVSLVGSGPAGPVTSQ